MTAPRDTEPLPPQNLDAEDSVIGAMLLAPAAIDAVIQTGLQPDDFYRERLSTLYRTCVDMHRRGDVVDTITITDQLERTRQLDAAGGADQIHELAAIVPTIANVGHYARIVIATARRRDLYNAARKLATAALDGTDLTEATQRLHEATQAANDTGSGTRQRAIAEPWRQFEQTAGDRIPTLVDKLWPVGAFGFIAAPPKKGKTWLGLDLAISVAAGVPFLGLYDVPHPEPVVYVALEGHRAAIRTRIGALARGHGINPDQPGSLLEQNLHILYKPRGINLADPNWVQAIRDTVAALGARLVIVDVLRAAAQIKENSNEEFNQLRAALQPLTDDGVGLCLLHHFGKLTETTKERTPGERMAGAGAMYGALDVGLFITGRDSDERRIRLEFELRDLATPDPVGLHLAGTGTGENGGFVYRDTATWTTDQPHETVAADDVLAPASDIYDWLTENGGQATSLEIRAAFRHHNGDLISDATLRRRDPGLERLGVEITHRKGMPKTYRIVVQEQPDPQTSLIETITDAHSESSNMHRPHFAESSTTTAYTHPRHTPDTPPTATPDTDPCQGSNGSTMRDSATPLTTPDSTPLSGVDLAQPSHSEPPTTPDSPYGGVTSPEGRSHPEGADHDTPPIDETQAVTLELDNHHHHPHTTLDDFLR